MAHYLKDKYLGSQFKSYGHFRIGFLIRGKEYYCITTNTMAIDRINEELPNVLRGAYYPTQEQALSSLYSEVKQHNHLD